MSTTSLYTTLAAAYDCNSYGAGSFNEGGECETTTTGGQLVDTGSPYFVPLATGILLVVVALSIIAFQIIRRRKHN